MERFFKEKCAHLEGYVTQNRTQWMDSRNISFDESEALLSLIHKKKEDSSLFENSEVNKLFTGNSHLKKEMGKPIGNQMRATETVPLVNPYAKTTGGFQPYVPEHVAKVGHEEGVTISQECLVPTTADEFRDKAIRNNYLVEDKTTANVEFANNQLPVLGSSDMSPKEVAENPPSEMYGSGIRIRKNTLKDSISNVSLTENGLLEYFIDEKGFLVDQNGCPISDESGQPIQLTEENINYLKNQNLFEETNE